MVKGQTGEDLYDVPKTQQAFDVSYHEGADAGYRWYDRRKTSPLFAFGHGLSYTTFEYGGLSLKGAAGLTASFRIANTGKRAGTETAQMYVTAGGVRRLAGWSRVFLRPGEQKRLMITAEPRIIASFDTTGRKWRIAPSNYQVEISAAADAPRLIGTARLNAGSMRPGSFDREITKCNVHLGVTMKTLSRQSLSILLPAVLATIIPGVAQAKPSWTDVYSASPASYSLPADALSQMKALAEIRIAKGTVRMSFLIAEGGKRLRIRLSNEEGDEPLQIAAASVALADPATGEPVGPLLPLRFSGNGAITVPSGAPILSDPVDLTTKPFQRIVVNLYLPTGAKFVGLGGGVFLQAPDDQTASAIFSSPSRVFGRPLVTGALVETDRASPVVVTMGDSITDGVRAKTGDLAGYPEVLARRLQALPGSRKRVVVNAGIAGNRVLTSGWGPSAIARLDRDVLRLPGVSHLFLLEGINDIGLGGPPITRLESVATPEQLIAGYRQIIERAHARGIKVVGATLMPFEGAFYFTPQKESVRVAVNQWIRTSGQFDGFVDFDAIARNPAQPTRLRAEFDSGDHLHPGDKGYRAMGEAIDLNLFR